MFFNKKAKIDCTIDVTNMTFTLFCRKKNELVFNIFKNNILPLKGTNKKGILKITYTKKDCKNKYGQVILRSAVEKYDIKEILKIDSNATQNDININNFLCHCNFKEQFNNEFMILNLFK